MCVFLLQQRKAEALPVHAVSLVTQQKTLGWHTDNLNTEMALLRPMNHTVWLQEITLALNLNYTLNFMGF